MNEQANSGTEPSATDEDCFLFTSESVGEGHSGELLLACVGFQVSSPGKVASVSCKEQPR